MKFHNIHFDEYLSSNSKQSLHPKLNERYKLFPDDINDLGNIIFYGPKGVGKYTQVLSAIKKYSPTELKYEKKISLTYNKNVYFFKISDIHFEIDMSLLGCHSRLLWNDAYNQLIDIISTKINNNGIIICKYFHEIHSELLEIFYSYMQSLSNITITFIIITEHISFIPDNILNCCQIIPVPRPSRALYNKCIKSPINKAIKLADITNLKNVETSVNILRKPQISICDIIYEQIIDIDNLRFLYFRDSIYNIFIYSLDVSDCIWYIIERLIKEDKIPSKNMISILRKTYSFFQYYNNNYRPIYHLESYIFYLISIIHGFPIRE